MRPVDRNTDRFIEHVNNDACVGRVCVQMALESARQFAIMTPYNSASGLGPPPPSFKMESSSAGDACVFGTSSFQQHEVPNHQHHHHHHQHSHPQHQLAPQQQEQFYAGDGAAEDQLMRHQQMMMVMAYHQHGGVPHNVYGVPPVPPPGGTRLRHDDAAATPGERAVNFTHPFSITNIMSARQRQQQQQQQLYNRGSTAAEFDDIKTAAGEFPPTGEPPPSAAAANDVANYYHHPRLVPPPCVLQAPYVDHVTDRKSASINGGSSYDALHYGIAATTTAASERPDVTDPVTSTVRAECLSVIQDLNDT